MDHRHGRRDGNRDDHEIVSRRYVARRIQPGPGPHTLITSNLNELRAELEGSPQRALPQRHARSVE